MKTGSQMWRLVLRLKVMRELLDGALRDAETSADLQDQDLELSHLKGQLDRHEAHARQVKGE